MFWLVNTCNMDREGKIKTSLRFTSFSFFSAVDIWEVQVNQSLMFIDAKGMPGILATPGFDVCGVWLLLSC